ncbi:prephenate dehydrogenase [Methylovulum psychrotolerans]|uniref:prephenate dehydrogenase n=1 Tax=Methylovulum psychrotolerans TaxID=1704499 RepID=A0A2S5CHK0_9GAMM|nr:prephenate dehydrogenase/arogenate dehydrogenase family protein [Methylovulum psychrotolerans]POZ50281.1 Prephenate dehydrogenase [Methylovulum psychrotolerans]
MFNTLCVIGVGLIGGSVARTARVQNLAARIVGFGRDQDLANLQLAKQLGVIDEFYLDIAAAVAHADCVVIATPVATTAAVLGLLKPHWSAETVYTDVGSTKGSVLAAAEAVFGYVPDNLVPAHPIAGGEQSGVSAAVEGLFAHKRLIITPVAGTDAGALAKVQAFWQGLGSVVSLMDAQHHDSVLAATSHLPHVLAFALVDMLGHKDEQSEIFKYAAGGFKDFTRIASSDPTMWAAICTANKQEILPLIEQLRTELAKIHALLAADDYAQLFATFAYAQTARERFLEQFERPV